MLQAGHRHASAGGLRGHHPRRRRGGADPARGASRGRRDRPVQVNADFGMWLAVSAHHFTAALLQMHPASVWCARQANDAQGKLPSCLQTLVDGVTAAACAH